MANAGDEIKFKQVRFETIINAPSTTGLVVGQTGMARSLYLDGTLIGPNAPTIGSLQQAVDQGNTSTTSTLFLGHLEASNTFHANTVTMGLLTTANGDNSLATGSGTTAAGVASHAEGSATTSTGPTQRVGVLIPRVSILMQRDGKLNHSVYILILRANKVTRMDPIPMRVARKPFRGVRGRPRWAWRLILL